MKIVIAGAGIGGMTFAALAARSGHEVVLVEKASAFGEVGAGIQISPNGARVLHHLELADELARVGTTPERTVLRRWADDSVLMVRPLGDEPLTRFGLPYYNVYRPDLVAVLTGALDGVTVHFDAEASGVTTGSDSGGEAALKLADGTAIAGDVIVGADGIHSAVRTAMFGQAPSRFSRYVAYRALVPREKVPDMPIEVTNRVGPDAHLVSYFVGLDQRVLNLVCVVPEPGWEGEGWTLPGSVDDLRAHFAGWAPEVAALLNLVEAPVFRWALHDRPPMERWVDGRAALLGDACHAMLPFMAQGACQSIEDAAILSRLLDDCAPESVESALAAYQRIRQPRAADLQRRSWRNATTFHLPDGPEQAARDALFLGLGPNDAADSFDWLFGYDALTASLT